MINSCRDMSTKICKCSTKEKYCFRSVCLPLLNFISPICLSTHPSIPQKTRRPDNMEKKQLYIINKSYLLFTCISDYLPVPLCFSYPFWRLFELHKERANTGCWPSLSIRPYPSICPPICPSFHYFLSTHSISFMSFHNQPLICQSVQEEMGFASAIHLPS